MRGLHCDREEAEEVYNYDMNLKDGQKAEHDLSAEQQKIAQKFAHTGTRKAPTAFKFTKRERKPNATKGGIIEELSQFLTENSGFAIENVQILNKERQIAFDIGADKFELTLVQKRKPKK